MIWGIIGGVLLSLLASELYDSCPRLAILLLRSASRRLPAEYRDRYWEEWMGELDAQQDLGKLRRLLWALWVFLSGWQMGRTLKAAIEQPKRLARRRAREAKKLMDSESVLLQAEAEELERSLDEQLKNVRKDNRKLLKRLDREIATKWKEVERNRRRLGVERPSSR